MENVTLPLTPANKHWSASSLSDLWTVRMDINRNSLSSFSRSNMSGLWHEQQEGNHENGSITRHVNLRFGEPASWQKYMVSVGRPAFANHYHRYGDPPFSCCINATFRYVHSRRRCLKWLPNHLPVKAGSMFATQIRGQGWSILLFIRKRKKEERKPARS